MQEVKGGMRHGLLKGFTASVTGKWEVITEQP